MKINFHGKSLTFMLSQGFLGNVGVDLNHPSRYVQAYKTPSPAAEVTVDEVQEVYGEQYTLDLVRGAAWMRVWTHHFWRIERRPSLIRSVVYNGV